MPHLHKDIIHTGRSKFDGYMLSLPFHSFYAVISLQLQFGPVIIWLIVGGVACLEDKWGYVVGSEKMFGVIIEVAVMDVKEENLGVELAISICPTEETHCLHPSIPFCIY